MTNLEILNAATALVCEGSNDSVPEDYAARAPYLLSAFCTSATRADAKYRAAYGLDKLTYASKSALVMTEDFPLSDVLTAAAAYYLGAMLVLDENEELSKKLLERCDDELDTIVADATALLATAEAKAAAALAKQEKEAAEAAAKKEKEEAEAAAAARLPFKKESIVNVY